MNRLRRTMALIQLGKDNFSVTHEEFLPLFSSRGIHEQQARDESTSISRRSWEMTNNLMPVNDTFLNVFALNSLLSGFFAKNPDNQTSSISP